MRLPSGDFESPASAISPPGRGRCEVTGLYSISAALSIRGMVGRHAHRRRGRMGSIHIDDSRHPLVTITFDGVVPDAEFESYLRAVTKQLERKQKNVTILDARKAGWTSATQRR